MATRELEGCKTYHNCLLDGGCILQAEFSLYKCIVIVWFSVSSWFVELHEIGSEGDS